MIEWPFDYAQGDIDQGDIDQGEKNKDVPFLERNFLVV